MVVGGGVSFGTVGWVLLPPSTPARKNEAPRLHRLPTLARAKQAGLHGSERERAGPARNCDARMTERKSCSIDTSRGFFFSDFLMNEFEKLAGGRCLFV